MDNNRKKALSNTLSTEQVLYALIDAAADAKVIQILKASGARFETYFPNAKAQSLLNYVPYLVEVKTNGLLLNFLINEFWNKGCCIFLGTKVSFEALLMHLESLVYIECPDGLNYFRFHDPRVLPDFLETASNETLTQFFGQIDCILVESDQPETDNLMRFSLNHQALNDHSQNMNDSTNNRALISKAIALGTLHEQMLI